MYMIKLLLLFINLWFRLKSFILLCFCSIIDWNNPLIINKMYKVYLGDIPLKSKVCALTYILFEIEWFYLYLKYIWIKSKTYIYMVYGINVAEFCVTKGGNLKQELKHEPVSTRVKLKILPHLLRSRLAAECFPANIQVWCLWCAFFNHLVLSRSQFKDKSLSLFFLGRIWWSFWSKYKQQIAVTHFTVCSSHLHGVRITD